MLILRDMTKEDIDDYVVWFTEKTEWLKLDSPSESFETTVAEELKNWQEYYEYVKSIAKDSFRSKFEIEVNGIHIGFVSMYKSLQYVDNIPDGIGIGIDIPDEKYRNKGYGKEALVKYINYLRERGYKKIFMETWSGNIAMIKVLTKLSFQEYYRKKDALLVDNKNYDAIVFEYTHKETKKQSNIYIKNES